MTGIDRTLRTAVIGAGHLGRHHARILAGLPGVDLVAVVDTDPERAREVAAASGARALTSVSAIGGPLDAVVVAVPTEAHEAVAVPLLEQGIAVLVEKPIAPSLAAADRMLRAADASGAVFGTGHTERFNPAVTAARAIIREPRFVEVHRLGVFPERSLDIDVVFDLMIHDLDLLLSVVGPDVVSIEAVGVNVLTPRADIANARLRFASGCIANLTASRISRERVRKVRFFQQDAYVAIDYAEQDVEVYRLDTVHGRTAITGGKLEVPRDEPLRCELVDFVDAVRRRREPGVSGSAGRLALALAEDVAARMRESAAIWNPAGTTGALENRS